MLLATKIGVPRTRPDLLLRPHLVARLEDAARRDLVLVSTPAGFGKTTLLASWARSTERPVAWLSLDPEDNDPARFWRYVAAAVDQVRPGAGQAVFALFEAASMSGARPNPEAVVSALVNELVASPGELVLVLDDYHLVEASAIHEGLVFLLEHLPPGMNVVISSRSDPPFPLARLRARGQMAELRADDLRFSLNESVGLLRDVWKIDLTPESIASLEERTEGWVTGLQLAALSLRKASNPAGFIQGFTGSNRFVLDYLAEEALEGQPGGVQAFLLKTSILERLNADLCASLLAGDETEIWEDGGFSENPRPQEGMTCQETLEYLETSNLFLVPLDDQRRWYRYHHLFADLLRSRLQSATPERVTDLHRKAAVWYQEHDLVGEALRHALAAGETSWAARLVEGHVEEILSRGEGETLRRWLDALPAQVVRAHPRLALAQAIAVFNAGRLQDAEHLLDNAEGALANAPDEHYEPKIGKEMSMLANVPASIALMRAALASLRGDAELSTGFVRQAQADLAGDEHGPLISVRWNLAQADWTSGRLAEAGRAFAEIVSEARQAGEVHLVLTASYALGRIQRAQGQLDTAFRTFQEGLDFATQQSRRTVQTLSAGVAHQGLAEVYYERNQIEQASTHAGQSITLGRQLVSTQSLADGLASMAWIRQASGDPEGARQTMEEACGVISSPAIVSLHNPAPAERARLWLAQGYVKEAEQWVESIELAEKGEISYARELDYLVLARLLLKQNQPERALDLLERLEALARAQGRLESSLMIWLLQALGLEAAGKADQALKVLAMALAQAEPQGYVRTFVDEGRQVASLLHRVLARGLAAEYAGSLLAAFPSLDREGQASSSSSVHSVIEPLSQRELEVLNLLAGGASNQEIADQLLIAQTTAKKHVSNIIAKLGVKNRTQAVSRARDLGLL